MTGQGECDNCGQLVVRLFTPGSVLVELDPHPHPDGTRAVVRDGMWIRVLTLTGTDLPYLDGPAYNLHRCPQPAQPVACASPTCRRPAVPLLDAYHPDCHPEVTDRLLADRRARIASQFKQPRNRRRRA